MGSHEGWAQPSALLPNGLLQNVAEKVTRELDMERWSRAEERAAELIACIQPNQPSEARRKAVVDYVRRLVMNCISCQVFTFGSVPLKTYLPDGDIDLTAFSENENLRDNWAQEVRDKLEIEEKSANAEFQVKGVQFIQAEVKIIKCLIENIVVDISFNQLGGLCTLCFLDEIDHLINHDHLFKRSVILIKAWCYYESRILGAHHGLISTYALETLVLYIFHVFNNCFAGPLEVLCRFLEFFSNFDWDNFCVGLWGPVRINSLPDMTAEPPRNDNGQLLLNKIFLDACSSVYAVFPPENQNQPFVSKYFNVIDPLRANNNLGRSVSKGNFYRIRSAFAFGARRLARVLECPNENLIAEINQFFVNTWERHGNGIRSDAPLPDLWPPYPVSEQESKHQAGIKKKGESILSASQAEKSVIFHGTLFQPPEDISHYNEYLPMITTPRAISHGRSHDIHTKEKNSCGYNQAAISNDALQVENSTALSSGHVSGEHERFSRHLFVRTRSSPRLIDQSVEDFPRGKRSGFLDSGKNHYFSTSGRGKSFVNAEVSAASHRARSSHIPVPLSSSVLASVGYDQRSLAGIAPANGPLVDSPRLSNGRTFPRDVSPSPVLHYIPSVGMASKSEEILESGDDNSGLVNFIGEDGDGNWHDQDDCPRRHVNYENGNSQMTQPDEEQAPAAMAYISLSGNSFSNYFMREKHEFFEESKGQIGEDSVDSLPPLSSQGNDNYLSDQNSNMRYMPESQTGTSRSKPGSESSWDGSSARSSKSRRDKRGRNIRTSSAPSTNGELKSSWHHEGPSSDRASSHGDDNRDWLPLSTVDADMVEKISEPASIWPLYLQNQQLAVYNNTQMSGLDSVMPVAPVLVNSSSSQRAMNNSGIVPITFYPTIFFPVNDFPAETVNSESLTGHSDIDDAIDSSSHVSQTTEDTDAAESLNQSEMYASSSAKCFSDKHIEEHSKRDILNGDFASHWLNLQYGRFCQHTRHRDSVIYTSSGTFPQMYSPWEGTGRPISSANVDLFARMGYGPHLVPVSLQPGSCQPPAGLYEYQRYRDEVPKCRSGTGTYLPNPVSYRERESSLSRGQRGNYDHKKSERGESEINWNVGSKTRLCGYIQGSNQTETQNSRPDRLGTSETRKDWQRVPHKPKGQNKSFSSSNSVHANSTYGLHGYSSVNSNVVASPGPTVPPVVMFYPCGSNVGGCSSPPNELKFGSFGPVTFSRENEASQPVVDLIKAGCAKRHGTYPAGSSSACPSPDKPSTPHLRRSVAPRNILAER